MSMSQSQVNHLSSLGENGIEKRNALAKSIFIALCAQGDVTNFKATEAASAAYVAADAFLEKKSSEQDSIKKRGIENLIAWVKNYGSEKLKIQFEMQNSYEYVELLDFAESEFFEANAPEGFSPFYDQNLQSFDIISPTVEEVTALFNIQQLVKINPDVYSGAELSCIKYVHPKSKMEINKKILLLKIKAPNYITITTYKELSQTKIPA